MRRAEPLGQQHVEPLSQHLFRPVAEHLLRLQVEERNRLRRIDRNDPVFRHHQDAREQQVAVLVGDLFLPPHAVVAERDEEARRAADARLHHAHIDRHLVPVLVPPDQVEKARLLVFRLRRPARQPFDGIGAASRLLRHEHGDALAGHLGGLVAEQPFGRGIEIGDLSLRRRNDDRFRYPLHQYAVEIRLRLVAPVRLACLRHLVSPSTRQ